MLDTDSIILLSRNRFHSGVQRPHFSRYLHTIRYRKFSKHTSARRSEKAAHIARRRNGLKCFYHTLYVRVPYHCRVIHAPFSYFGGTQPTVMLVGVADTITGAPGGAEGGAILVQSRASREGNPYPARVCAATRTCCDWFRGRTRVWSEVGEGGRARNDSFGPMSYS